MQQSTHLQLPLVLLALLRVHGRLILCRQHCVLYPEYALSMQLTPQPPATRTTLCQNDRIGLYGGEYPSGNATNQLTNNRIGNGNHVSLRLPAAAAYCSYIPLPCS
jgi:hypothetical protein